VTSVLWFRRDLRLHDHPALAAAAEDGPVVALFVLDPKLLGPSGAPRVVFLVRTLQALGAAIAAKGGQLVIRHGDPVVVVPQVVRETGAAAVHISADFNPYGRRRDDAVERALGDVPLVRTGSPYAVAPGRVLKADGTPYRVYGPYYRGWKAHGFPAPARSVKVAWASGLDVDPIPDEPELPEGLRLAEAGEDAARKAWRRFYENHLPTYGDDRNRPDLDHTSRMSPYLKWGSLHPRTLLAELTSEDESYRTAEETYRRELAWRDFYANIIFHFPDSARDYFDPSLRALPYLDPKEAFDAWRAGRTGYPIVDAGMRQLLGEGWMHNRVRMIVASFLVKDLHIEFSHGARHFMRHLIDADLASNQHGWQWTAGTGTDPSPYYRVFNPVGQGQKFDPNGDYVRRWIPELRGVPGGAVHEPWELPDPPADYPARVVDHAVERKVALADFEKIRQSR
jgi:deoxyribodipyrimidine photo-lyase